MLGKVRSMMQRALVFSVGLSACGPRVEPAKTAERLPNASTRARPAAAAAPQPAPSLPLPPEGTPPPITDTKQAEPSLHDVCFAMCDRVDAKCPKNSFETCRLNCAKYDPPAEGCEGVVRAALACARDAADLVCATVAPESCARPFRQIAACTAGQRAGEDAVAVATALPSGYSRYENSQEGLSAPMPVGVVAGEGNTLAQAKHPDGASYSIRKLQRPEGKLNEKVFLKLSLNLLGRCSDKMKLRGMVDKPGRTSINYTTTCADGSEERGLLWATDQALFVASVKGQAGKLGDTETFLYGFEVR